MDDPTGGWWACERPEQRFDYATRFHPDDCRGCLTAEVAAIRRSGSVTDDIIFGHRPSLEELNDFTLKLGRYAVEIAESLIDEAARLRREAKGL